MYNQPTEPWYDDDITDKRVKRAGGATAPMPPRGGAQRNMSRRKLFGVAAAGVAGAAVLTAGGMAFTSEMQHGTWNPLAASATNVQIGHLLRRAGFGATPQEISAYASLGFGGAVDRLLGYQQINDDAMESRLKALNLDLNKPQNQQQWWLLRMAWTQRPLLEKMTLFWHGVLTSSYHKVGGKNAYARM
ncbi:MAG TPA: DUF1800 family protein, partial [Ktedonobacteraceae bacterium]|nr:DUF1800 family protein [Ktedonobacteraceae bacterium]